MRTETGLMRAPMTATNMAKLLAAHARLECAKSLKRLRGVPGEKAARERADLEAELQGLDELAGELRAGGVPA